MPCFIAATNSTISSPACSPTMVAPRMRSFPGAVSTFTMPCALPSAMARSRSSRPYTVASKGMPRSFASISFSPTRECLGQLAADRAAAQDEEPRGERAQVPQRLRSQHLDRLDARDRRHERPCPRRDHDRARGEHAGADLHGPWRGDLRCAPDAFDAERGVTLHRIVRLHLPHDTLHALHYFGEVELGARFPDSVLRGIPDLGKDARRL